ncbi:hypothetical protein PACILC2_01530 [Paenibacillus cisolokensis]|uniref:Beta-lactamase-related domain-containing protein n=1 Tax=Paenibacillus cisolokensis TaxID=1658519 RepID=A0ABQ4N087_9BACL|nr:serine hydrolase domain-containing protein [Paenibacillus cisolokensis]GIQ61585.1 hypothetical protein PACILC2_01530 [Paenibacillus cisolokensis]
MSRAELMDAEAAETMGFAPERLRFAWEAVREAVEAGETPGAVAIVSRRGMRLRYAYGCSVDDGSQQVPISFDTIYDCASLTKIAVTLPLLLLLIDRGRLLLSDPLFRYIPGFDDPVKRQINVLQLLTHTSGLAPFSICPVWIATASSISSANRNCAPRPAPKSNTAIADLFCSEL